LSSHKKKNASSPQIESETQRLLLELKMQNEERERLRAKAEEAYRQYTDLYDFAPVGYFTLTREGTIREVNLAGTNLLGVDRDALLNSRLGLFVSDESCAAFEAFFEKLLSCAGKQTCELTFLKSANELTRTRIEATCFEGGQESRAVMIDITGNKQAEEQLLLQSAALNAAANAIVITDRNGMIVWVNAAFTLLTGYTLPEAIGRNPRELVKSNKQDTSYYKHLWDTILAGEVWHGELTNRRKDGSTYIEEQTITPLLDTAGKITHFIAVKQDITERKRAEQELRRLSIYDSLTGLYNRGFFMEEMGRLERGRDFPVSIVMADVDGLKAINDQQGHAAGDNLLKRVAQILTEAFRAEDVVARIGGDEFAVLLPKTDATAAEISLERVRQIIRENNIRGAGMPVHISLGVSTAEQSAVLSATLKEADANMYREKRGHDVS
jgi:diguanylate cyclase (GGDEF)-like protein/PAS domain S-box-containing protein